MQHATATATKLRREEKLVPIPKVNIRSMVLLHRLMMLHDVGILDDGGDYVLLRLTERSTNLPWLATRAHMIGIFENLTREKSNAYLRDLATLDML